MHSEVDFLERQVQQAQGRKQELLQRQLPELCAELAGLQVGRPVMMLLLCSKEDLPLATWHASNSAAQSEGVAE